MNTQQYLLSYARDLRKAGYRLNQIRASLAKSGANKKRIDTVIRKLKKEPLPKRKVVKKSKKVKRNKQRKHTPKLLTPVLATLVVLVLISTLFFVLMRPPTDCADDGCFIELAQKCKSATFEKSIDDALVLFEVDDCVLTKTIVHLSARESASIRALFEGNSMACPYERGAFSKELLERIQAGIENCEGDLKDVMRELQ